MSARQSMEVTKALKWLKGYTLGDQRSVKEAAKKFGVHESTLWRALGKINHRSETK